MPGLPVALSLQPFFELLTGLADVGAIEDGGNDADTAGASFENRIEVRKIDAADGEPGNSDVLRCPPNIFERDWFRGWFCAGGENRANRDISSSRCHSECRLFGRVAAQADSRAARLPGKLIDMRMAGIKKIFLTQMAIWRAGFGGNGKIIIDDQSDARPVGDFKNRRRDFANAV